MNTASVLTKKQVKQYGPKPILGYGYGAQITAKVRYDDECGNGHNSFCITAEVRIPGHRDIEAGGRMDKAIAKAFPELAPLQKWNLCSSDGPMHYLANARYWAGFTGWKNGGKNDPPNLEHLKGTIVYGALAEDVNFDLSTMNDSDLQAFLINRLPALVTEFRAAVESLGFTF